MPAGIFLMNLTFFFFNFIKIHVRLWVSCFVSLGLIVLMLLGRKEGRFFLIFQNQKKKKFLPPSIRKTRKYRELWFAAIQRGGQTLK